MTEKPKKPIGASFDLSLLIQWLLDNIPDLGQFTLHDVPHEFEIDIQPMMGYVDGQIKPLSEFFETVVKPSHRREKVKEAKESTTPKSVKIPRDENLAQKIRRMEEESAQRRRW